MADSISPGDVVQLRSGGPKMTVEWVEGDKVHVAWFDQSNHSEKRHGTFRAAALVKH